MLYFSYKCHSFMNACLSLSPWLKLDCRITLVWQFVIFVLIKGTFYPQSKVWSCIIAMIL